MPVTIASELSKPIALSFILNADKGNESTFEFNSEKFTPHTLPTILLQLLTVGELEVVFI